MPKPCSLGVSGLLHSKQLLFPSVGSHCSKNESWERTGLAGDIEAEMPKVRRVRASPASLQTNRHVVNTG